ncbi:MAG: alpha/beta hydrolase [Chthoniobacteraceae bacterium]
MRVTLSPAQLFTACLLAIPGLVSAEPSPVSARFEVLEIAGRTLRGNPLNDPTARRVAVFSPAQTKPGEALPVVYFLPGYGGSAEDVIAQGAGAWIARVVEKLAADGMPLVIAVPDCRNRWGGSQYLNSTAQGNYADYLADEIIPAVEAKYPAPKARTGRIVAGHSSGGYGALMLAMARQKQFGAVVALAPDSDFEVTHRPVVERPNVRRVTPKEVEAFTAPARNAPRPADGFVELILGLSAAYAPVGTERPGRLLWLYDEAGQFQPKVWQHWLDKDPLLIIRQRTDAFAPDQRIYLDGGSHDEWGFNLSARKMFDVLRERPAPVTFYEPAGGHSDRVPERLIRGLTWVFGKPVTDLP